MEIYPESWDTYRNQDQNGENPSMRDLSSRGKLIEDLEAKDTEEKQQIRHINQTQLLLSATKNAARG